MKLKLLSLFSLVTILATGCLKTPKAAAPAPAPSGIFTGEFKLLHRHTDKVPFDSTKATITVNLQTPAFNYTVTGDTLTLHAGSYGTFGVSGPYILFNDKTYSATAAVTKTHLSGYYLYNYDGTNLIMYASSSDTLVLGYNLKKTSN
ncbi:hypothetical protein ACPPVU_19540 [Mucilaginibacter sp. McL0603]|uniref:hypothetical protein n=1 Tax=Mucilaginibacter sp. McL0603 TaxID=3415670 RepID=UPI003CEB0F42